MQRPSTIQPLCKVSLNLQASAIDNSDSMPRSTGNLDFIYGIGTEGLTAFEKEIHGRCAGDRIEIRVEPCKMHIYFEHLLGPLIQAVGTSPPFDLSMDIRSVAIATDRELIRALADKGGGGGCNCGCGC